MRDDGLAALEMAEIAGSSDPLPRRGEALAVLRRSTRTFLARPTRAPELELAGTTCPTAERAEVCVPPRAEEGQPS